MKKHLKWIIPVLTLVVLLAAAAVAVFVLDIFGSKDSAAGNIEVYWNVDKDMYWDATNGCSTRVKIDEYYRVRFAVGGEQIDYFVETKDMMDRIDSQKFVGLDVDENNVVKQVLRLEDFSLGLAVYQYYVVEMQDGLLICNNLASGRGLPLKLKINDKTQIYDVGGDGLLVGLPCEVSVGSQVYGVMGLDGYVSHLFVAPPFEPKPVYWNIDRQYDSTSKTSTRDRDVMGYFTYEFVVEGKYETLRTQDLEIASKIDSFAAKCMHLEFDEEGMITNAVHAKFATGGASVASWYHVLRLDSLDGPENINVTANGFYAEKFSGQDKGSTVECTISDKVQIYDMTGIDVPVGTPTELQLFDQVHCLTDPFGDVCVIFVVGRSMDVDLYYNLDRKWDSSKKVSTRTPDANGWYWFDMSVNGVQVKLKTQDADVVNVIDERAARVLGLQLDGDVIVAAHKPGTVSGSEKTVFDYSYITSIGTDDVITCVRNGISYFGQMTDDTKIYNVSSTATKKGEPTTLQIGDRLYAFSSFDGKLTTVYVVGRMVDGPVYWNLDRTYDTQKQQSKRKPAEDGYYYIKLSDGTKTVEFKTKSKSLVDTLDSYVAVALKYSGNVITEVYKYDSVDHYNGSSFASWKIVSDINGNSIIAKDDNRTYSGVMTDDCVVYDVSQGSAVPVTKTTLQLGDRIHGMCNADGRITAIYVVERKVSAKLYYNVERKWDDQKKETTRTPDAKGYYVFLMSVDGKQVELKTNSKELANAIDSRAAKVVGLSASNGMINKVYKPSVVTGSEKTVFDYAVVTKIAADGTITAERNGETFTGKMLSGCKVYHVSNLADVVGEVTTVQVGDTVYGLGPDAKQLKHIYVTKRQVDAEIYYNVDRMWEADASTRKPNADGWYVFTMAINGKQVQLKTKDANIVAIIDGRAAKAVALEVKDGVITGAHHPSVLNSCQKTVLDYTVVTAVAADGTITTERNGKTYTAKADKACRVYNVSALAKVIGENSQVQVGDTVYGLGDNSGKLSYIYITSRYPDAELYYNVERMWTNGASTRVPDADGWYIFTMAMNGKQVQVKTKDNDIVALIDGRAAGTVGLKVTNGVIEAAYVPGLLRSCTKTIFDYSVVTEIRADGTIVTERNGNTYTATPNKGCQVYNVSALAKLKGENSQVQVGDTVYGLGDNSGKLNYIYITNRYPDAELYYNVERMWANGASTRVPDADGWYTFTMAINGKQVQVKTKDNDIVALIDGRAAGTAGLKVTDGVIEAAYVPGLLRSCTKTIFDFSVVTEIRADGTIVTQRGGNTYTAMPNAGCQAYNVSELAKVVGEVTEIRVGDTLYGLGDNSGKLNYVYVTSRPVVADLYYNTQRMWADGASTRVPDADGWYTFTMAFNGSQVTLKTKDADIVALIDGRAAGTAALHVKDGVITEAYAPSRLTECQKTVFDYSVVTEIRADGTIVAQRGGNTYTAIPNEGCQVYNVSDQADVVGEVTTVQLGDTLYALGDKAGAANYIYVVKRSAHAPHCVCAGLGNVGDHTCTGDVVWQVWNGTWADGGYYYLEANYDVTKTITIEEGKTLNLCLNGFDMIGADTVNRIFNVYGVLNVCDHKTKDGSYAGDVINRYDITKNDIKTGGVFYVQNRTDAAFNLYGGNLTFTTQLKNGGIGGVTAGFNMYDGKLIGNTVSGDGGVLYLEHTKAVVNLYGGEITGGSATNGGNIYIKNGKVTIDGATISGGYSTNAGGSIRVQADTTLELISGKISGGEAKGNGGNIYSLGNVIITGGTLENGNVPSDKIGGNLYASGGTLSITDDPDVEGAPSVINGTAGTGGNLAIKVNAEISGCSITGGTANTGADIYFEKSGGTLTVHNCGAVTVYVKAGTLNGDDDVDEETP